MTITLATLKDASAQEVFDQVVNHLRQQGVPSIKHGIGCVYRSPSGLKCAAGALIADEEYKPEMDVSPDTSWYGLVNDGYIPKTSHDNLIQDLQRVHDSGEGHDEDYIGIMWETALERTARKYKLQYTPPTEEVNE